MEKISALLRQDNADLNGVLRHAIVLGCAAALIFAGPILPGLILPA